METETTVRISVPVSEELNERLAKALPWGVKAQVVRSLLEMLLEAELKNPDRSMAYEVLKGNMRLVHTPPTAGGQDG